MLNPGGSLHGACAAFLIDAYVFHFFPLPPLALAIFSNLQGHVYSCTTLVFVVAARSPGVSASMDIVYHAPAAL
jgi:hypothetical protein